MEAGSQESQVMPIRRDTAPSGSADIDGGTSHSTGPIEIIRRRPLIAVPAIAAAAATLWVEPAAGDFLLLLLAAGLTGSWIYRELCQMVDESAAQLKRFRSEEASDRAATLGEPVSSSGLSGKLQAIRAEFDHHREAARRAKEHADLLSNTIAASIIIRDHSNRTVFCSPFTQVLTGHEVTRYTTHDGDFHRELVVTEDLDRYDRAHKVSFLGEDTIVRYRIRHRSGLKLWLETRLVPVCDDDGEAKSVMSITIDVTETLNYQRQIEEHNRDLADFTYMVSHDLKAPVFTIKGMAQVLNEDFAAALGETGLGLLKFIIDAGERIEQLVKSVIEYSAISIRNGDVVPVKLNGLLAKVISDQTSQIRETGAVIEVAPELPTVQGDEIRLYQLFSNLVGNAIKYRRPEVPVKIGITSASQPDGSTVIRVKDNGMGIPPEKLDLVFRPYHRAHGNQIEGSGIGLACVKKIIDRLGGSVSVESTLGEGSTFIVTFPAALPPPQAIPPDLQKAFEG